MVENLFILMNNGRKKTKYTEQIHIIFSKENIDAYLSKFMKLFISKTFSGYRFNSFTFYNINGPLIWHCYYMYMCKIRINNELNRQCSDFGRF